MMLSSSIRLLRPYQWVKNLVVFGGLIFAKEFTNPDRIKEALLAFVTFCLLSSAIYVINDIIDRDSDRLHPIKRQRPIASGAISVGQAWGIAVVLLIISAALTSLLPSLFIYTAIAFVLFNLLYSYVLKNIVIIDVMSIAVSFVLRAAAGSFAIDVPNSAWLIACTFLLALFIGFGKRRHEIVTLKEGATEHRETLKRYSVYFLDQLIGVVTASTVVAYTFYTVSPEIQERLNVHHLELTIPFVLYGIFRYLYLIHQEEKGGAPTRLLLSDGPLLANIALWFLAVMAIFLLS